MFCSCLYRQVLASVQPVGSRHRREGIIRGG